MHPVIIKTLNFLEMLTKNLSFIAKNTDIEWYGTMATYLDYFLFYVGIKNGKQWQKISRVFKNYEILSLQRPTWLYLALQIKSQYIWFGKGAKSGDIKIIC